MDGPPTKLSPSVDRLSYIDEGAADHQLATHFGTKAGIDALAEFVGTSKAFQKQKAQGIL